MAYTVARENTVFGNKRAVLLKITADAATQTIETGLPRVDHIAIHYGSGTSSAMKIAINSNASGVQSFGVLGISGATSGDDVYVTVFGPA